MQRPCIYPIEEAKIRRICCFFGGDMKKSILGLTLAIGLLPHQLSAATVAAVTMPFVDAGAPSYIPLPGSTVAVTNSCAAGKAISYPDAFPDITSRFAIANLTLDGKVNYGPVGITAKNQQYRASVDYASTDVVPIKMWIRKTSNGFEATRIQPTQDVNDYYESTIPVLIGVGFRVTAEFIVTKGKAEVAGLSIIGASASADRLRGTMMVEAIGVSGEALAAAIPLPSRLDQTTVESAILALGAGRASMYSGAASDRTSVRPRVVGMLSPGSNSALVNVIQAELVSAPVTWSRPCSA